MSAPVRFALPVLAVAVTFALGLALRSVVEMNALAFLLFTPAILFSGALGGLGPGLLATVLGGLAGEYIFRDPLGIWPESSDDIVPLGIFFLLGVGISYLSENLMVARREALRISRDMVEKAKELERAQEEVDRLARDVRLRARDFETLFEVAPIGIGIATDPECQHISVNPAFAELLQITVADNASLTAPPPERRPFKVTQNGKPVPPEDLPLQRAARLGVAIRNVELDVERSDGSLVSLHEFAAPLFDEAGSVRGAIGAFLDITERRRAERAQYFLDAASMALGASLDYANTLRSVADLAVPDYADWCLLDLVTPGGGVERAAWAHRDQDQATWLANLDPDPWSDALGGFNAVRDGLPLLVRDVTLERAREFTVNDGQAHRLLALGARSCVIVPLISHGRVNGALWWTRGSGRPAYDERDLAVAEELGRRAATAVENARLYKEAQQANQLKDQFLATLSHEIRTPLNALLGWVQLLQSGQLTPDKREQALAAIQRSAKLQADLTSEILDVSRAITGKLRLELAAVSLASLVADLVESLRPAAESKGLVLDSRLQADMPKFMLDPARIQQVMWNLLSNAVKFTPAGKVSVRLALEGDHICLEVRDSGVGIPPEFLPFVFDRFRQADASSTRPFSGLGLGLSIARHLVELHGGTIEAHSEGPGLGARFSVRLPATPADRAEAPQLTRGEAADDSLSGVSILVVDDDEEGRELVRTILEQHGATVRVSASAAEAFAQFNADSAHLVVTDIAMPGEDGFALLARIRAREAVEGGHTPVVALSAHARPEDRRAALAAGFQAHLTKPFDPATFVRALAGLSQPS